MEWRQDTGWPRPSEKFYVDRVRRGLKADIKVDSRIENINESSVQDVYEVILLNPLKRISDKGYLSRKRDSNGKEQFVLNQELLKELTKEDIADILDVVNQKLNLYYARADGNESDRPADRGLARFRL